MARSPTDTIGIDSFRALTGVAVEGGTLRVANPHARLAADAPLEAGWYEVAFEVASRDRFAIRKRMELTFDGDAALPPVAREQFSWNRECSERFLLRLSRPACRIRLELFHAEGPLGVAGFAVKRLRGPRVVARAVTEKVRLTRSYNCLGPALGRGVKLLRKGRFREFGTKVINGLSDGRAMRLGQVAVAEMNAAWTRRHALPASEADDIRRAVNALERPPAVLVLLPVGPRQLVPARVAAQSVVRQLYPHWLLAVCSAAPPELAHALRLVHDDSRVRVVRTPPRDGLGAAVARALADTAAERVLVLPPGVELAEDALYRLAVELGADPESRAPVGLRLAPKLGRAALETGAVWAVPTSAVPDGDFAPDVLGETDLARLVNPTGAGRVLDPVLAHGIDDRPLIDPDDLRRESGDRQILRLGADIRGIGGYDHLTYALLQGLPGLGAELVRHPVAMIRHELVPPRLLPVEPRQEYDRHPLLAVGPPFLVPRFGLTKLSAVYTMWETDTLDPVWVPQLNEAGVVVVPSAWQAEQFRRDGVSVPIEVAPLGFDPLVFHPTTPPPDICTFGTAGALTYGGVRKNAQWLIDVFRAAFPGVPDVRLRVKISPGSTGVETFDDPRIDVIRAALPAAELADWYRSLTCYLNGSSGEGFGLHLIEAMACGRPLVTPNYSGLTAFFTPDLGYCVDYRLVPVKTDIYTGRWAELDRDSFIRQMREVYADPGRARELGGRSAARAGQFTWKRAGRQLRAALVKHHVLNR